MKKEALFTGGFLSPEPDTVPGNFPGEYIPGGRNVEAYRYVISPGYPPFPDRAKWIGMLTGSWLKIGESLGARAGDKVRVTSDIWWRNICSCKGKTDTLKAMKLYEEQIAILDPGQIDFLKGVAKGAAPWLSQSIYAELNHELFADNYWRVLAASIWDCWYWGTPEFPKQGGCNSIAMLGVATSINKTIVTHSRHTPHDGLCYQQACIIKPPEGNSVWTVAPTPAICGNLVINEKGVSISHHAGGMTNPKSLEYPGGPFKANAFGVPWLNLILYAAIHANTAKEAIEILTIGPQDYLERTGKKTILRDGRWNWMVTDSNTLAVVEASANRYAIRYAGEYLGTDWNNKNYIACANHALCEYSYDENNIRTDIPMTIFNVKIPGTLSEFSEDRFWTLMWDLKERYGLIDKYLAQHILKSTYFRDKGTGKIFQCAQKADGEWDLYAHVKAGVQGMMINSGLSEGTNICGVAILDGFNSIASWNLGNPFDWEGAWDEYHFTKRPNISI